MTRSNIIDIQVIYQTSTPRAICVRETEGGSDVWLPHSEVEIEPLSPRRRDVVTLTGPEWLLIDKGLI